MDGIDYKPSPTASRFMQSDAIIRAICGPIGCIAPETVVLTEHGPLPIWRINRPMRVLSWNETTCRFQLSWCGGSFPKGTDYLYRVTTPLGEFDANEQHLVYGADRAYQRVRSLTQGQSLCQYSGNRPLTDLVQALRESQPDAPRYYQTAVDSLARYAESARRYGQRLLMKEGIDLEFAPLPSDAHTSTWSDGSFADARMGGRLAQLSARIRQGLFAVQKQIGGYWRQASRLHLSGMSHIAAAPSVHNVETVPQFFESSRSSDFASVSDGAIISVTRQSVKRSYWDMQVLDTNNYVTVDGVIHHNSGKSVVCAMELVRRACEQQPDAKGRRRTRFAVIRNTVRMLKDTTIKTVHDWLPPGLAGRWYATTNTFMLQFTLPDKTTVESEWMFRPLESSEDVRNLLSLELTGAWINEYREVNPDIFINLLGRIGRFPKQGEAPPTWVGVVLDTNPPAIGTFWHKLFESDDHDANLDAFAKKFGRPVKGLFRQPSGMSEEAENKDHLPEGYYELLLASGQDEDWLNVHVHGEYGTRRDGLPVYPMFNAKTHKSETFLSASPHKPLTIGIDFGLTPAAAIVQQNARGQWLILAEFVTPNKQQMGMEQFAPKLKQFLTERFPDNKVYDVWADPAGDVSTQADMASSPFQVLRNHGFKPRRGQNSLDSRLGSVRIPLNRMVDGLPGLMIDPRCNVLIEGFMGGYKYITTTRTDEPHDVPDKTHESHVHDALQYALQPYEAGNMSGKAVRKWGHRANQGPMKAKPWSAWG